MGTLNANNRLAVYTAIIGDYDDLRDPEYVNSNYDYICFTDNDKIKSTKVWNVLHIDREVFNDTSGIDSVRFARFIKIMSHVMLPMYKRTLWVDSNTIIVDNVDTLLQEYSTGKDWLLFKHTQRDCIYDEANACLDWNLDDKNIILNQINRFKSEGYPSKNGLIETNVMYRHVTDDVISLCEMWWSIVKNGSRRDQLSQMYCFWKLDKDFDIVPQRAKDTKWFKLVDHRGDRRYHVI